ncbi:MAG: ATP phosphoribosyltransferase regulatory subunit [Bauldia sp.]
MESPIDRLKAVLAGAGYDFIEPPVLHDADIFLDLAGEDLRRRMYLTASADGLELCLRPDYTIPVALHHLTAGGDPKRVASYAYCGPVFRQRPGETGEFWQAGVESIGRTDRADADADVLALALTALGSVGIDRPTVRIGDQSLFDALLDALPVPDLWRRRLARAFGDTARLHELIDEMAGRSGRPRLGPIAARHGGFPPTIGDVREEVARLFAASGIPEAGGRTVAEIAERYFEHTALTAGSPESLDAARILSKFLAISGPPDRAALALGELAASETPAMAAAIGAFAERTHGFVRHGIDIENIRFAADFGRRLDYYTGFIFELSEPSRGSGRTLAGGGRYDRLLSLIRARNGTGDDLPAVGFALWLDRLGVPTR